MLDSLQSPPFCSRRRWGPGARGLQAQLFRKRFHELSALDEALLEVGQLFQVDGVVAVEPLALQREEDFLPVDVSRAWHQMAVDQPIVVGHMNVTDVMP